MNLPKRDELHPLDPNFDSLPITFTPANYTPFEEEGISLLDYWRGLKKRKWWVLTILLLAPLLAYAVTALLPRKYTTEVSLIPLAGSGGGGAFSSLASQLSSLPLLGGQMGGLGSTKSKEIVNILKSKTLAEKIIIRYDLLKEIFPERWDANAQKFVKAPPPMESGVWKFHKDHLNVQEEKKTGLINIQLTMKDPALAAKAANGMIVELQDFINNNSLTTAKRNRLFIEEQLLKNAAKLLEAGKNLNQFYADNRISSVAPFLDVNVGSYESLPLSFEEFRKQLESYRDQMNGLEKKREEVVVKRVPGQVYLQYLTLNRELLAKAHALLVQQYEIAKIEESKEDLAFQVLDKAQVKINPSSPGLKINLGLGCVLGFLLAAGIVFFSTYIEDLKKKEMRKKRLVPAL